MLFSLLVANYNNSRFLDQAIESVMQQTYPHWEIVIVDDGSTDEFEDVVTKYTDDSRVKIHRNSANKGCAYTKWRLASLGQGELMAFLDPDDTLHPHALEIMASMHVQFPNHSIIHSTHYVCDNQLNVERISEKPRPLPPDTPYLFMSDGSIHAFATFKSSCYRATAGLLPLRRNDKAVDQDLYYILEEKGPVLFIDKPLYYYRIHDGSISNWGNENAAMIAHFKIIEDACIRRIKHLRTSTADDAKTWIKRYQTRYHKVRILNNYRKRRWLQMASSMLIFPFVGGMDNIISYVKKLPVEGMGLVRKSFVESYKH